MGEIRTKDGQYVGEVANEDLFGKPFLCVYGKNKPKAWDESVIEMKIAEGLTAYVRFNTSEKLNKVLEQDARNKGLVQVAGSFLAKREMLDTLGIDEIELFRRARENTTPKVTNMGDVLAKMGCPFPMDMESPLKVVTARERDAYGAGILANKLALKALHQQIGDYTIIPSSIHEIIVIPEELAGGIPFLSDMIRDVNATEVADSDVLSDNAYKYDNKGLHKA